MLSIVKEIFLLIYGAIRKLGMVYLYILKAGEIVTTNWQLMVPGENNHTQKQFCGDPLWSSSGEVLFHKENIAQILKNFTEES